MKKNRKVFFLIPRMGGGGAERVVATLANEFSENNIEVKIITLTTSISYYSLSKKVAIEGAQLNISKENMFIRFLNKIQIMVKSPFYLYNILSKESPDVLISFLTPTNILAIFMKWINLKTKIVVSERNDPFERSFLKRTFIKFIYSFSDLIVVQSNIVAQYFRTKKHAKAKVIENPIDTDSLFCYPLNQRKKEVVAVGRLFKQKNFSLLIKAFSRVLKKNPEYSLSIYGEGPKRKELERLIRKLKIENNVSLKGAHKNVFKYAGKAEVFVLSSNYEGFPNVLLEAMGSGLPVISTDFATGVASDLVGHKNGIIIEPKNELAMSIAIDSLINNKELQKLAFKENQKIIHRLSKKKIFEKWRSILGV